MMSDGQSLNKIDVPLKELAEQYSLDFYFKRTVAFAERYVRGKGKVVEMHTRLIRMIYPLKLSNHQTKVLLYLVMFACESGSTTVAPGLSQMVDDLDISREEASRALTALNKKGHIQLLQKGNCIQKNVWSIPWAEKYINDVMGFEKATT